MKPPETYLDWSNCLDRLMDNSLKESDFQYLDRGKLEWSKGSAERFAARFNEAYDHVLKQCADRLQKNLSLSANREHEIVNALTSTRRTLTFLFRISLLKPIPQDLSKHLQSIIETYAKRSQSSLEQSANSDRSGRLASLLRNNSLLNFNREASEITGDIPTDKNGNTIKPQRRIILS